jgi:PAS domain-containing protein
MDHLQYSAEMFINNQKQLEQEHFRIIAENSRDLIKIIDTEGYIDYASPSHCTSLGKIQEGFLGEL